MYLRRAREGGEAQIPSLLCRIISQIRCKKMWRWNDTAGNKLPFNFSEPYFNKYMRFCIEKEIRSREVMGRGGTAKGMRLISTDYRMYYAILGIDE